MCRKSESVRLQSPCECETKLEDRLPSGKEALLRLREYKKSLEAELKTVNKNLESTATAAEGGDGS